MQLAAIGLYSHDGRVRALRLRTGSLNVISGVSRTGKTELLKIIDYCVGRGRPDLAVGPITRRVSWFAALFLADDGRQVLVARPQPRGQLATTAMLAFGVDLDLPEATDLVVNATTDEVRGALDDLVGLGRFDIEQYGRTRERLRASVSHAIQFCLQAQTELMSPTHLFHRGSEPQVAADFAELFPYFVGATDEERLAARRRARDLRRQLTNAERQLERAVARLETEQERDRALVEQAVALGLADADTERAPRDVLRDLLLTTSPATASADQQPPSSFAALRTDVAATRAELRELQERRAALSLLDDDRTAHLDALRTQVGRLEILGDIQQDTDDTSHCPACGAALVTDDPTLEALSQDVEQLDAQLAAFRAAARDIAPAERELDVAIEGAAARHSEARARLQAAESEDLAARQAATDRERQQRLLGVVEEYLRSSSEASEASRAELAVRIQELGEELAAVEPGTDLASEREELDARLAAISDPMTLWARQLRLEAADDGSVFIDRGTLNVSVGTPRGRIGLRQMGSGANHVGYHIVAHLGLHRHFVLANRPVPRFIVFDQPSLPYFPQGNTDLETAVTDEDWESVRRMMRLVDQVVRESQGEMQALITEHASFPGEDWYDEALLEDWHQGTKLVPEDWPDA